MLDTAEVGTDVEPVLFNPFESGSFADPYDQYAWLRTHDPVHHSPLGLWMFFAYEDCFTLLRDPTMSVEDAKTQALVGDRSRDRFAEFGDASWSMPRSTRSPPPVRWT